MLYGEDLAARERQIRSIDACEGHKDLILPFIENQIEVLQAEILSGKCSPTEYTAKCGARNAYLSVINNIAVIRDEIEESKKVEPPEDWE